MFAQVDVAEGEGFEPSKPYGLPVFKTGPKASTRLLWTTFMHNPESVEDIPAPSRTYQRNPIGAWIVRTLRAGSRPVCAAPLRSVAGGPVST